MVSLLSQKTRVIEPAQTRPKLIRVLAVLENKRDTNPPKKHGNIPL
jgi:propionyl-CoA carboxylase beta chain